MAAQSGSTNRRAAAPLALVAVVVIATVAGYAWHATKQADSSSSAGRSGTAASAGVSATAGEDDGPGRDLGSATSSPRDTAGEDGGPGVPQSGTGRFAVARASGAPAGHGKVRRYMVEVEGGIDLSAGAAAHEIAAILADPRGWTADGHDAFQLVSSGSADFVIKIATPDTVDDICGAAGLDTGGEVNCDVGPTVVVNLKRWTLGSPQFHGPIQDYRALIINHEVGHRIGHGHEGCPGPGKLAPVMMQQIKGLHGCVANAWPYDRHGHYIQGPPVS
ncbi:DUF3152 domain-containing protein [Actinacidiphila acididurans]|uniref:DUF3152 domain-containing protein n=1 Tax=Actinacidiphila acididurans TaxID=2784346 RepID=A0ABS2TQZ7_9ACTN|nr:DUF3152 domain-containing protein [Actinacidiphila acididurans]MBM9505761.1 DUF3152 domain-containing protein [Actinacidiphila acididurans]